MVPTILFHIMKKLLLFSEVSFILCISYDISYTQKASCSSYLSLNHSEFSVLFCFLRQHISHASLFLYDQPWNIWSPDVMKPSLNGILSRWPIILFALHPKVSSLSTWHPETDRSNLAFPDSARSNHAFAMNHVIFWFSWSEISFWTSFLTHNEIMVIYN